MPINVPILSVIDLHATAGHSERRVEGTAISGCSSVGRASRCQRDCRGFESHQPLFDRRGAALSQPRRAGPRRTSSSFIRGCSSVGRALRSQCRGREFESPQLHFGKTLYFPLLGIIGSSPARFEEDSVGGGPPLQPVARRLHRVTSGDQRNTNPADSSDPKPASAKSFCGSHMSPCCPLYASACAGENVTAICHSRIS